MCTTITLLKNMLKQSDVHGDSDGCGICWATHARHANKLTTTALLMGVKVSPTQSVSAFHTAATPLGSGAQRRPSTGSQDESPDTVGRLSVPAET